MKKGTRVVATVDLGTDNPSKWSEIPRGTYGVISKVCFFAADIYKYEVIFSGSGIRCKEGYPVQKNWIRKV